MSGQLVSVLKNRRINTWVLDAYRYEIIALLCFVPMLVWHFQNLWKYDHYQYFPLILLVYPYLVWTSRGRAARLPQRMLWEQAFLVVSLVLLSVAVYFWSPNLATAGFVFALGSVLLRLRREGHLACFFPLWLVLWFLVRIPGNMDITLIFSLQKWTSKIASLLVDALGINHVLLGNVLWVNEQSYFVEEACSGINSLFSLTAFTAVAMVLMRRPVLHCLCLIFAAAFWACFVNVLRVASIVIFNEKFSIDLLHGTAHTVFGLVLFGFGVLMVLSIDQLLLVFQQSDHVIEIDSAPVPKKPKVNELSSRSPSRFVRILVPVFCLLLVCELVLTVQGMGKRTNRNLAVMDNSFVAEALPAEIDGWQQTEFTTERRDTVNFLGERSAIWHYEKGDFKVIVSVDYPFWHWHELVHCYEAQGQKLIDRRIETADDDSPDIVIAHLSDVTERRNLLAFSLFRQSGHPLSPPVAAHGIGAYGIMRLDNNVDTFFNRNEPTFQVQVYLTNAPIDDEDLEQSMVELLRKVTQKVQGLTKNEGVVR